jgi:hypothetical protein
MKKPALKPCPCCGAKADVQKLPGTVRITCFRFGCRQVTAKTMEAAIPIWNEPRFTEVKA